jgi:Zn-dependent protease with chaperone function
MNFFERQQAVRRLSRRLVALFVLAVAGIVAAVDMVVLAAMGFARTPPDELAGPLVLSSLATLAVIGLASLARVAGLRDGGGAVAQKLGAMRVPEDTADPSLRRLRNVVEEIAIASATPVPEIYVLEREAGINAFAAGWSPSDAAVAVTRGAIERLNRDELQGVIAHEFSHILNGDMRLNIRLMGLLFGILVLGILGRKVLEHGRFARSGRDSKGAGGVMLVALAVMLIGYIGVFFGRLIKAGVSRQREYLADASAVQFTRQTRGIAGALKKIGALPDGSHLSRPETEEVSHMLFGEGVGLASLFATHPPLLRRIQALEPSFRGEHLEALSRQWLRDPPSGLAEDAALGLSAAASTPRGEEASAIVPTAVVSQVGLPDDMDMALAGELLAAVPQRWKTLARASDTAMPLLFALLYSTDAAVREHQQFGLAARHGQTLAAEVAAYADGLVSLPARLRLPLAELAFPALRRLPRPVLDDFSDSVYALVHADGEVSVFEYCLGHLLRTQVHEALDPARHWRAGRRKLSQVQAEVGTLLALLAQAGHAGPDTARRAFHASVDRVLPHRHLAFSPPTDVRALDALWGPLDELQPLAKSLLVEALVVAVSHDGVVTTAEAELLRTVCAVLHCPLPPALGAGSA